MTDAKCLAMLERTLMKLRMDHNSEVKVQHVVAGFLYERLIKPKQFQLTKNPE
jgi:hypothetical protein